MTWLSPAPSLASAESLVEHKQRIDKLTNDGVGTIDQCKSNERIGILQAYYGMSHTTCHPKDTYFLRPDCPRKHNNEKFATGVCSRCNMKSQCSFNMNEEHKEWGDPKEKGKKHLYMVYECFPEQPCDNITVTNGVVKNFNLDFRYWCLFYCTFIVKAPKHKGIMVRVNNVNLVGRSEACCTSIADHGCPLGSRVLLQPEPRFDGGGGGGGGGQEDDQDVTLCDHCHTQHLCFRTNRLRVTVHMHFSRKASVTFQSISRDIHTREECPQYENKAVKPNPKKQCLSQGFVQVGDQCFRATPVSGVHFLKLKFASLKLTV